DVALAANPDAPGYVMVAGGKSSGVGGTSAATPAFAGVLALVSEDLGTAGLGQLGPTLYRLGGEQARGLRAPVFHDVTQGDNGGFAAAAGFDLATGWGSPIVDALAPALAGGDGPCVPDSLCLVPRTGGPRRPGAARRSIASGESRRGDSAPPSSTTSRRATTAGLPPPRASISPRGGARRSSMRSRPRSPVATGRASRTASASSPGPVGRGARARANGSSREPRSRDAPPACRVSARSAATVIPPATPTASPTGSAR